MQPSPKKPIKYAPNYERHFAERIENDETLVGLVENRIALFINNKSDSNLSDHALSWKMQGLRAFSITKDIRVVYEETETTFIFRDIGTHNQVYR